MSASTSTTAPIHVDPQGTTPTSETGLAPAPRTGAVAVRMGTAPTSIDEAWRLAVNVANSDIIPKDFQRKPANVLIAIEASLEVGIPWLQGVQGSAIINGRHGFFGDLFLAILITSPKYAKHVEYYLVKGQRRDDLTAEDLKHDDTKAVCTFWRRGNDEPTTRTFSVAQAKKANLWSKEGPWQTYPDRQLRMRARSWAGRDCFPDVLKGMRSVEELRDMPALEPAIDTTPIQPRRASETAAPPVVDDSERVTSVDGPLGTASVTPGADGPAEPRSEPPPPAAPTPRERRGLLITHTGFVRPKVGEPYYEVVAQAGDEKQIFVTRDEQLYKEAASFEGTDSRVVLTWHSAKMRPPAEKVVSIIDSLAIDESSSSSPDPKTGLFS